MKAEPNPGSQEARDRGCRCPVLDNAHGKGYLGGAKDRQGRVQFVIKESCPLHGSLPRRALDELDLLLTMTVYNAAGDALRLAKPEQVAYAVELLQTGEETWYNRPPCEAESVRGIE